MELHRLKERFCVCKITDIESVDFSRKFVFLSKTDDELSLVCEEEAVPSDAVISERGWLALRIAGILDFGMTGVIAGISHTLTNGDISLFVISTFNTDYILIKEKSFDHAVALLNKGGYTITTL